MAHHLKAKRIFTIIYISIVSIVLAEFIVRALTPTPFSYADAVTEPLRLWPVNEHAQFDIQGLYKGAPDVLTFNTTEHQFIAPEPTTQDVLFIGGSTTENFYVPQDRRWVAQLRGYNAAQSGADVIDETRVFQDITQRGYRFKLVVIATQVNDFNWLHRLGRLDTVTYDDDLKRYFVAIDTRPFLTKYSRLALVFDNALHPTEKNVAKAYQALRQGYIGVVHSGADCEIPDLATFERYETQNFKLLKADVEATGAMLLIMSEASDYGAPASSFKVDLRGPTNCGQADIYGQAAKDWKGQVTAYLRAAQDANVLTFNLADAMGVYTNGPQGGRYQYDDVHYTMAGSDKVAEVLRPVIVNLLNTEVY